MSRLKQILSKHRRLWTWLALGSIFAFLFALILLPAGIRWGAQRWLRGQGLGTAIIEDVEFNPFSGRLAVFSVFSIQTEDKRMNLGRSEIKLDWRPLLSRRVNISGFTIENVLIDVNVTSDGAVSVGGLTYKPQPSAPASSLGRPWQVGIGPVNLHNVTLVIREPRVQGRIEIWDAHLDPMDSAKPDAPTAFMVAMGVNGGSLRLGGTTRPFKFDSTTTASIRLEHLPLAWLGGLAQAQKIAGLGGNLDARATLKVRPAAGAFAFDSQSTVSLKNLCLRTSDTTLANVSVDWGGGVATTTSGLKLAGALKVSDLDAALVKQRLAIKQKELGWRGELVQGGAGNPLSVRADIVARGAKITSHSQPLLQLDEAAIQSARLDVTSGTKAVSLVAGLKFSGLRAALSGLSVNQGELGWQGKVDCDLSSPSQVRVQGALSARKFALRDRASSTTLALDSLAWNDAAIQQKGALVNVGGKLALAGLKALVAPQIEIAQESVNWAGGVSCDTASGAIKMSAAIDASGLAVRDRNTDIRLLGLERLDLRDANLDLKSGTAGPVVAFGAAATLGGIKAHLPEPALSVWQHELAWTGRVSYAPGRLGGFEHDGNLSVEGLTVEDRRNGLNALDLADASFTGIHLKTPRDARVQAIRIGRSRLLERALRESVISTHTHTLSFKELALGGLSYDGRRAVAESVKATGLVGVVVRAADGTLELQKWTGAADTNSSATTPVAPAKASTPETTPLQFRIGHIVLDGDSRFYARDASAKPPAFVSLRQVQLDVGEIDSAAPNASSPFKLSAGVGRYARLAVEGSVAPFAPTPTAAINTVIDSMELPSFSTYTQQYIGYKLMGGTLSLKSAVRIDAGILKSQNDMTLRMFELERLRPNEVDALSSQLGYPVNTALAMLRDANGDINLKIPVEGDLRNPQVGIAGVLRKALLNGTSNSIRSAVQVVYAPLGAVVSVGGKIAGQPSLACKPIEFAAGQATVEGDAAAYLDKLVKIMKSRPGLRVSFSGRATRADAAALAQAEAVEKYGVFGKLVSRGGDDKKPEPIDPPTREKLNRLANRRASAAVDYLTKAGIKPDRLFRRAASIDESPTARPRAEIAF